MSHVVVNYIIQLVIIDRCLHMGTYRTIGGITFVDIKFIMETVNHIQVITVMYHNTIKVRLTLNPSAIVLITVIGYYIIWRQSKCNK